LYTLFNLFSYREVEGWVYPGKLVVCVTPRTEQEASARLKMTVQRLMLSKYIVFIIAHNIIHEQNRFDYLEIIVI